MYMEIDKLRVDIWNFLYNYVRISNFFFFFSSRRRHTRFSRDWSSDVCSSDLRPRKVIHSRRKTCCGVPPSWPGRPGPHAAASLPSGVNHLARPWSWRAPLPPSECAEEMRLDSRSDGRRVGQEEWVAGETCGDV